MNPVAEYLFEYLRDVLFNPDSASMDIARLPEDFVKLGQGLEFMAGCISEMRSFSKAIARGDLNSAMPSHDNEMAAPLKALHATLRHLTWQTQQVASGDYNQRVDFLGDFAEAFNIMTRQLEQRYNALVEEARLSNQKSQALAQSNDIFELVTKDTAQWIAVVDSETAEWLFVNYSVTSILSSETFLPQLKGWIGEQLRDMRSDSEMRAVEVELSFDGQSQYFSAIVRPVIWRGHDSAVFVLTDISAEREHINELETAAYRDPLTKQYNRHYGMRLLEQWTEEGREFVLCFVDIDNLKYVNDKFGHLEGDKYILEVSAVLRDFACDIVVCRLGGDEFMLLLEGWPQERAESRCASLRADLTSHNEGRGAPYYRSMSYGVIGVLPDNSLTPSELLALADEKMYDFKRAHKMDRRPAEG
ncbi:MAG: diguanylate cyclase [Oscillospiraceae bacterium]|nr:diguanylate cyclase [Oscillospiraceae bacterium]